MNELLELAMNGDKESYGKLIKLVAPALYNIAKTKLNNDEDIGDAIQETTVKAYKGLKTLKHKEYFKTWITRILLNECNNILEENKKRFSMFSSFADNEEVPSTEDNYREKDSDISLDKITEFLNENERTIIFLYYKYRYSTGDIAKSTGESVNTVKSILRRAKAKIAEKLKEENIYE